ncbi:MAG: cytochrome c oxidase accessory protein FixG [Phenylobacterium sp.]|jgi:cytochrome c oxidase accessory protein FixG
MSKATTAARGEPIDIVNVADDSRVYNLYESREKIYTRQVEGFYQRLRLFTGWPLLLGYFLLPWINLDGRQALLFDLPARKFHVAWLTFWPQDFALLGWALIIAAFALFFVTTWLGRIWCGYSCPQTVWTAIYMWMEQISEGSRNQRIKLDKMPWSMNKLIKKTIKHSMWLGFGLLTGVTFIGYFYGIRQMVVDIATLQMSWAALGWVLLFSFGTYLNAGWLREQVCLHMCPYARFQAVMFDRKTLIVSYDQQRGESRGPRKRSQKAAEHGLGDCIDCKLCVHVCPTGIDIREGLQYECIDCALCIDACDDVMTKMGYQPQLISYTTLAQVEGDKSSIWRPKLIGYGVATLVMALAFAATLYARVPLQLDVIRDRGALYQQRPDGLVQNIYTLKIINMDNVDHQITLSVEGLSGIAFEAPQRIEALSGEVLDLPVVVKINPEQVKQITNKIVFTITTEGDTPLIDKRESRFFGPTK